MNTTTRYDGISRLALVIVTITAIMFAACGGKQAAPAPTGPRPIAVGDNVAAPLLDGKTFWLGQVVSISGSDASILFAGDTMPETRGYAKLRAIEIRTWAVGDEVLTATGGQQFYKMKVTAIPSPGKYTFTFNDKSTADVEAKYIIAP